ncbi:protein SDA1 [Tanacetum coccineum]
MPSNEFTADAISASGRTSEKLSLPTLQSKMKCDPGGYETELSLVYNQFKSSVELFTQQASFNFTSVVNVFKRMNQKHKNETENRALQSILFSMLQQEDENKAMRALVTVRDLHRRKVWFDDRAANAICRACFHPSSRIMIAALSFLLDYEKIEQEGDSDESDDEEEAVHQSHVVVSKEAIYKANNTGTTSSKKKKKAKLQRVIRSMKKQQRISSDRDSNSNYYSPLSSLKDPQGFAEKLFSRLQTCSERFEPHQRDITNLLAAAVQACHDMVPPDAVEPLFKQIVNQFVHDKSRTESIAVGLNVVREICLRIPLLMTEDLLQDLVQYKKSHEKAVSSAARSLISLFREKDRGRPTDPKKKPKAFGEVTIPSDVPGADLLRDDDGNDDVSDASDDDDHSIGTLGEEDANSEDDMSTHDGGSELNSDGDEMIH